MMENSTNPVMFECSFEPLEPEKNEVFQYTVFWYIDGEEILKEEIGNETHSFLIEDSIPVLSYGAWVGLFLYF